MGWGRNVEDGYQLGQATPPLGLNKVISIAAGWNHSLAVMLWPAPVLQGRLADSGIVLSWPANASNFRLQASTNPVDLASWLALPVEPAIAGQECSVTNRIVGDKQFYRLVR